MKKFIGIFFLLLASLVIAVGIFFFIKGKKGEGANGALKITSSHPATVFVDNEEKGQTPFDQEFTSGEYQIKLVPQDSSNATSWEGKVSVSSNVLTFINREFGATDTTSGGEVLILEKIQGNKSQVSVITNPDGATITFDNQEKGPAPVLVDSVEAGAYELSVAAAGFAPRSLKVKTTVGYKLSVLIDMASLSDIAPIPSPDLTASPTPEPSSKSSPKPSSSSKISPTPSSSAKASSTTKASPPAKPYIEVLDTPTDFLNVRKDPTTSADNILTKVYPGEYYKLLDTQNDWLQIEYEKDKKGWISSQYAKKYE